MAAIRAIFKTVKEEQEKQQEALKTENNGHLRGLLSTEDHAAASLAFNKIKKKSKGQLSPRGITGGKRKEQNEKLRL